MHSYKDLIVWQRAIELVELVYTLTGRFPMDERFGLTSQMRRAAVSIPSNIAEGRHRGSTIDYKRFLTIAFGSGAELATQLEIAKRLKFIEVQDLIDVEDILTQVMKMLNKLRSSLS